MVFFPLQRLLGKGEPPLLFTQPFPLSQPQFEAREVPGGLTEARGPRGWKISLHHLAWLKPYDVGIKIINFTLWEWFIPTICAELGDGLLLLLHITINGIKAIYQVVLDFATTYRS